MDEISFSSDRDRCAAWHFNANGDAFATVRGVPCVGDGTGIRGHSGHQRLDRLRARLRRRRIRRGVVRLPRVRRVARLYARRGYTPERAALNILRAAGRNRAVAPVTPAAHLMYALTRIAPPVARWLAARTSAVLAK
jgi:hypothetical protein